MCIHLWWSVDFQVSSGFLIKAYTNDPSFEPEEQPEDPADFVGMSNLVSVYLVEPRQASLAVLKFSGTLGMPHCSDRRSATIMAFSHFVLEDATCGYMFADIQGKSAFNWVCLLAADINTGSMDWHNFAQNESALTLFDPMTHTPRGWVRSSRYGFSHLISSTFIVNLVSATMVLKVLTILLHPTSAPAFALQWTCARCLIYRLPCRTGRTRTRT